jgi:hypothetical protein
MGAAVVIVPLILNEAGNLKHPLQAILPWNAWGKDAGKRADAKDFFTGNLFHYNDKKDAKDAQAKIDKVTADNAAKAETIRIESLQQPKQITPDNFLANKNEQLNKLRLGFASTMSGAGSLALPANPGGKSKLGL